MIFRQPPVWKFSTQQQKLNTHCRKMKEKTKFDQKFFFQKMVLWTSETQFCQPHWNRQCPTKEKKVELSSFFYLKMFLRTFGMELWQIRQKHLAKMAGTFHSIYEIDKKSYVFQNKKFFLDMILRTRTNQVWQPRWKNLGRMAETFTLNVGN